MAKAKAADPFAIQMLPIDGITPNPKNVNEGDVGAVATAIAIDGWHGSVLCADQGDQAPMIVVGEHRWRALATLQVSGFTHPDGTHISYEDLAKEVFLPPAGVVPCQVQTLAELRTTRKMLADNRASALSTTDDAALAVLLSAMAEDDELPGSLYDGDDLDNILADLESAGPGNADDFVDHSAETLLLADRFVVPPFSVLDTRQGYWQERKRAWLSLGIQSELGRGENMTFVEGPPRRDEVSAEIMRRGGKRG